MQRSAYFHLFLILQTVDRDLRVFKNKQKMYDLCKLKETKEMVCKLNPGEKHKKQRNYLHSLINLII